MGRRDKLTAYDQIRSARIRLVLDHPFFGALALRLKLVEDPTCATAWVDGVSMGYNPTWFASLTFHQQIGLVAHEVMHCAAGHSWRRGARTPRRWNWACDYAINQILLECGFKLPPDGLVDDQFKGKSAEWIYPRLPEEVVIKLSGFGTGKPQSGQGGSPQPGGKANDPADGSSDGEPGEPQGGGGAAGTIDAVLDVRDAPVDSAVEGSSEADWQQAVQEAAAAAHARGKLPANLQRLVKKAAKPRVDWRSTLHRFIQQAARSDYSWRSPNTRFIAHGLYLPSLRSEECLPVAVVVDTSGSVDGPMLDAFVAELRGIASEVRPSRVYVLYADAAVHRTDTFEREDEITIDARGGGGTDFRPAIAECELMDDQPPACIVYLTDLMGAFPDRTPELPVLWASPPTDYEPPFGEHVVIE